MEPSFTLRGVTAGHSLPILEVEIGPEAIIRYCGASNDYSRPHWDQEYMRESRFSGIIVHGWFTMAQMIRSVECWVSPEVADVQRYSVRYLKPVYPGHATFGGVVEKVGPCDHEGARMLTFSLWARNSEGEIAASADLELRVLSI